MNHKFEKRMKRIYALFACLILTVAVTVCQ